MINSGDGHKLNTSYGAIGSESSEYMYDVERLDTRKWDKRSTQKKGVSEPMRMHKMAHHTWPECYPVGDRRDIV